MLVPVISADGMSLFPDVAFESAFPTWRPFQLPIGVIVVDFSMNGKTERSGEGDIPGIFASSVGRVIGGKAISLSRPLWRTHFPRLSSDSFIVLIGITCRAVQNCTLSRLAALDHHFESESM